MVRMDPLFADEGLNQASMSVVAIPLAVLALAPTESQVPAWCWLSLEAIPERSIWIRQRVIHVDRSRVGWRIAGSSGDHG
jgi:hypothetical protein